MTDLEKLKYPALDIGGSNYIVWSLESYNHLCAEGLSETVDENFILPSGPTAKDVATRKDAARAVCMILRHLPQDLKFNYLEERNPALIWKSLRLRFDTDRKQAMLPLLNDEWNKLCFYNFKTVTEYTTKLYSITSELSWCGKKMTELDKIEKTLTTFSPAERILAAQYRRMNHLTFDKLVAALLLDEKHGLLLQRNHDERRLPSATQKGTTPEVNYGDAGQKRNKSSTPHRGKKQWKSSDRKTPHGKGKYRKVVRQSFNPKGDTKVTCYKCGLTGHVAPKCRTPELHCKLYQQSKQNISQPMKGKGRVSSSSKNVTFMTDFSDDSDNAETHCVESYNSTECGPSDCLIDSATTHVILKDERFFIRLEESGAPVNVKTIGGVASIARGAGEAYVSLPNGTLIHIKKAIYAPTASRNLLSFLDLRRNGLHVSTATLANGKECLRLTNMRGKVVEECEDNGSGLYASHIVPSAECAMFAVQDSNTASAPQGQEPTDFELWHDRSGHPGRDMLKRMHNAVKGMSLKQGDFAAHGRKLCQPCAMGKLQNRPKVNLHGQKFKPRGVFDTLVSDVCGHRLGLSTTSWW